MNIVGKGLTAGFVATVVLSSLMVMKLKIEDLLAFRELQHDSIGGCSRRAIDSK